MEERKMDNFKSGIRFHDVHGEIRTEIEGARVLREHGYSLEKIMFTGFGQQEFEKKSNSWGLDHTNSFAVVIFDDSTIIAPDGDDAFWAIFKL